MTVLKADISDYLTHHYPEDFWMRYARRRLGRLTPTRADRYRAKALGIYEAYGGTLTGRVSYMYSSKPNLRPLNGLQSVGAILDEFRMSEEDWEARVGSLLEKAKARGVAVFMNFDEIELKVAAWAAQEPEAHNDANSV